MVIKMVLILMTDEIRKHISSEVGRSEPDAVNSPYLVERKQCSATIIGNMLSRNLAVKGRERTMATETRQVEKGFYFERF